MAWKITTDLAAKYFGKHVGDEVDEADVRNAEGRNKPVTMTRLFSLQRQFRNAKAAGNRELQAAVNRQFGREFTIYLEITGESGSDVLDKLKGANNSPRDGTYPAPGSDNASDVPHGKAEHEDHEDDEDDEDDDLIILNERELLAHVWAIAARLVELRPELRVSRIDQTPSMPIYIVHDAAEDFRLQFDLIASVWISANGEEPVEYLWLDLIQTDLPETLFGELQRLGVLSGKEEPTVTKRNAAYRLISQILDTEAHGDGHWTVPQLRIDFDTADEPMSLGEVTFKGVHNAVEQHVQSARKRAEREENAVAYQPLWVLERDLQPLAVVDAASAKVHLKDEVIDLFERHDGVLPSMRALAARIVDAVLKPPLDMSDVLSRARLAAPPLGDLPLSAVEKFSAWTWGTRYIPTLPLYMCDFREVLTDILEKGPVFSLCHAGHGQNSYALSLVSCKGPVAVFIQHHWGGAYGEPERERNMINATFNRVEALFAQLPGTEEPISWMLVYSSMRGFGGVIDVSHVRSGNASEKAFTEFNDDNGPIEESEIFDLLVRRLDS